MQKQILFFDIDGTLIDEKTDVIPQSAKVALKEAKANGHRLYVCSGRCRAIIPENVLELGFDGMICGCGTYIEINGEALYHHTLSEELQQQVIRDLQGFHIDGVLEGKDCSAFRRDYWMPEVKRIYEENGSFQAKTQVFWDENISFDKMALWFDDSSDMDAFRNKYQEVFDFILRDPTFYEVVPKGISKATGIYQVCRMIGADIKDTIAFGDSSNDIPMLECTARSVAMGGGNPILYDLVDYVTTPVMEDGIANALRYYKLIKE